MKGLKRELNTVSKILLSDKSFSAEEEFLISSDSQFPSSSDI